MGKIRSGLSVLASTGILSGALLRSYLSFYWKSKRQAKKTREKVRKIFDEQGFRDDVAEKLAEVAVPDVTQILSIGKLMNLGRERKQP